MIKKTVATGFIFAIGTTLFAAEISTKVQIKKPFKTLVLKADTDSRYNKNTASYHHYGIGIQKKLQNNWSYSLNFRKTFRNKQTQWEIEDRPFIQVQKKGYFNKIKWRIRNRFDYRIQDNHSSRYRLQLKSRTKKPILGTHPFISNEFFYNFNKSSYNKNWFAIGVTFKKYEFGTPSLYYKIVSSYKNDSWTNNYVMTLKLSL
ncbi:hypothetical protein DID77_02560 [Candidatus Marinamargulisbacteria bacterium SCGC AG-439-L15]|nr:hypothetical protein DID77_02560 [Candidatus Marinamargulisbacteria bacterium SCGC AG-439-L15]